MVSRKENYYQQYVDELHGALSRIPLAEVERGLDLIYQAHREERDVYVIGNGGSASTASHMACDLGKGASIPGKRRLRITSLNDNMAHFSALANDIGYEHVFVEQLRNLIRAGDLLIGISASGNSPNTVKAFEFARGIGAKTIGLLGFSGGAMKPLSDVAIHVKSDRYGPVEDAHLIVNHIWTEQLRERMEQEELVARW
jgi:D-sedoheptulose 7-phosphate isomerase